MTQKRMILLLILIISTVPVICFRCPAGEVVRQGVSDAARDFRAVHDMARIRLSTVLKDPSYPWILARVKATDSGMREEIVDWRTDADGRWSCPDDSPRRLLKEGTVTRIGVLTCAPEIPIQFFVREVTPGGRDPEDEATFSPFNSPDGGLVICRINERWPGLHRFRPALLVPDPWEKHVARAIEFQKAHAAVFDPKVTEKNLAELRLLLVGDNPFLATEACRTLAASGALDERFIAQPLASVDHIQTAVLAAVAISTTERNIQQQAWFRALMTRVDGANKGEVLRGVALAACVELVDTPSTEGRAAAALLYNVARERAKRIAPDEYLADVLRTAAPTVGDLKRTR